MSSRSRPHGNAKYQLEACRCYTCCKAASDYNSNRRRAIAYGRWKPYIDAEPVREHIRSLSEFGIGWMRLARLAGVPRGNLSKLIYGDPARGLAPSRRVRPDTALKLLAVEPTLDNLGDRTVIDATGTRRRLQALVRAGWHQSELARRLGILPTNFSKTITKDLVTAATVKAVQRLYDELWRIEPTTAGVPAHRAEAARNTAQSPPMTWPDAIACGTGALAIYLITHPHTPRSTTRSHRTENGHGHQDTREESHRQEDRGQAGPHPHGEEDRGPAPGL